MAVSEPDSGVIPVPSLQEYFRDSVDAAMASNRLAVESHTAHYVVNLLTLFSRSEALHDKAECGIAPKPLALMLADAAAAPTDESRNATLQHLGDVALFVAGFMAEGLDRKAVGIGYYVRMGGGAYHTLSLALPANPRGRAFAPVFAELAAKFGEVVDVLNDVRHASNAGRDQDVLRLYENWLTTGSQRAGRLLRQLGIQPLKQPGSVREH
ncbi:MAG: hypothetical protein EXR82_10735 [Gammaproteobacteria bacterium]|nr:hypothetical protein [Gammaproteobacteria bacterium]